MARCDNVEIMARQLVGVILRNPRWDDSLDDLCRTLHADAAKASPRQTMIAVAVRAETMLRHIAQGDYVAIGRLYFDLLPEIGHPLTEAVISALSQPISALRLMRESGLEPRLRKDESGATFIEIEAPSHSHTLCEATRNAITTAMTSVGEEPQGALRTIH